MLVEADRIRAVEEEAYEAPEVEELEWGAELTCSCRCNGNAGAGSGSGITP